MTPTCRSLGCWCSIYPTITLAGSGRRQRTAACIVLVQCVFGHVASTVNGRHCRSDTVYSNSVVVIGFLVSSIVGVVVVVMDFIVVVVVVVFSVSIIVKLPRGMCYIAMAFGGRTVASQLLATGCSAKVYCTS